jgi:hypothetical protein
VIPARVAYQKFFAKSKPTLQYPTPPSKELAWKQVWSAAGKENQTRHEQVRKGRFVIRRERDECRQVVKSSMYANFLVFRGRVCARVRLLSFFCAIGMFSVG